MVDEGVRRRLPSWMMGRSSNDNVQKPDNGEDTNNLKKEKLIKPSQSKAKTKTSKSEKAAILGREDLEVSSGLLVKCGTKRTKRKSNVQDAESNGSIGETISEERTSDRHVGQVGKSTSHIGRKAKRGRLGSKKELELSSPSEDEAQCDAESNCNISQTVSEKKICSGPARDVRETTSRRKQKSRVVFASTEVLETSSSNQDDAELTMEDLMSFAEEYVKADEDVDRQPLSRFESEAELPMTASSRSEPGGGSFDVPNNSLPTHEKLTSSKSTEGGTSQGVVTNACRTGDPAQDMLDLFLGPLLTKPAEEENKFKFRIEELTFSNEIKKQSQNKEEIVPLTKKKSSLRDKVAMFLE